jgi:hypothetical protein
MAQIKTYNLKLRSPKESKLFNDFKKVTTYKGLATREALLKLITSYLSVNRVKPKLATETEVLAAARAKGLSTTKAILIKHRVKGNLNGLWYSDTDDRIVYELVPVLAFLKKRSGRGSGGWLNRTNGSKPVRK